MHIPAHHITDSRIPYIPMQGHGWRIPTHLQLAQHTKGGAVWLAAAPGVCLAVEERTQRLGEEQALQDGVGKAAVAAVAEAYGRASAGQHSRWLNIYMCWDIYFIFDYRKGRLQVPLKQTMVFIRDR